MGPDRKLFLPVSGLSLDGSGSSDDRGIVSYHWDAIRYKQLLKIVLIRYPLLITAQTHLCDLRHVFAVVLQG